MGATECVLVTDRFKGSHELFGPFDTRQAATKWSRDFNRTFASFTFHCGAKAMPVSPQLPSDTLKLNEPPKVSDIVDYQTWLYNYEC